MMEKITTYKKNCAAPRLSDEEPDLMEQEDANAMSWQHSEGWTPWGHDELIDIHRIMEEKMPVKQREVLEAFLAGITPHELGVTEKYWRYHYKKAIEFIKREIGA